MVVQLIPVLEIEYPNEALPAPKAYPYWEHPVVWEQYRQLCLLRAGFAGMPGAYGAGSSFYRVADLSDRILAGLVTGHTAGLRGNEYGREHAAPLYGGYVLRVDGSDKFFPQCCSDLSEILYWQVLANGHASSYFQGHPGPSVSFKNGKVRLDFSTGPNDEPFSPPPPDTVLDVDRGALAAAVTEARAELERLAARLREINRAEGWGIDAIDELLIWGDTAE